MTTASQLPDLVKDLNTDSYTQSDVYQLAKGDLDFFAGLALPLVTEYDYPQEFKVIWEILIDLAYRPRDFTKVALGLPRGFGKTSLVKLFALYCVLYTDKQFITVVGSASTTAENILADIADMLDDPNIKAVYGDWRMGMEKDTQDTKKFGFRGRNIILKALGQGGSATRGLNIKNQRPDVMIFDDIQTRSDADSETVSLALETWMIGTAMKAASHKGCLYIFIANMYPTPWSLLRRLKTNPEWIKFIAGGILADGTSLWEALKPLTQLLTEFRNDLNSGHPEIFYSEVLNDENANVNVNIDLSRIPAYPFDDDEYSIGNFIVIDPSNDKANSDAVSIGLFQVIDGKPVIREILEGRFSPGDTIKQTLAMAVRTGTTLILIEGNAYQYSLCYWFGQAQMAMGLYEINAVPIYSGSRSKNSRILDMFKSLIAGEIIIHPSCMAQVANQIVHFNALKTNNTDGILDLLCYATRVLTEFPGLITILNPLAPSNTESLPGVLALEETCIF
jgi:hypothetical protein